MQTGRKQRNVDQYKETQKTHALEETLQKGKEALQVNRLWTNKIKTKGKNQQQASKGQKLKPKTQVHWLLVVVDQQETEMRGVVKYLPIWITYHFNKYNLNHQKWANIK